MTEVPEDQVAVKIAWAICEYAEGAGPGKCDPEHCLCGEEGRAVAQTLYRDGWRMIAPSAK